VQWSRDNIGLIGSAAEIETLARTVDRQRRLLLRPGLLRPLRPALAQRRARRHRGPHGLHHAGHLARAVLEATAWQTREVVEAMNEESGVPLSTLRVDGGMTANHLLMQTIADVLDVPVVRPIVAETPSLGAAYAAGLAVGFWSGQDELRAKWHKASEWLPAEESRRMRERGYRKWQKAVQRTLDWVDEDDG
jgi:glycerol kinase